MTPNRLEKYRVKLARYKVVTCRRRRTLQMSIKCVIIARQCDDKISPLTHRPRAAVAAADDVDDSKVDGEDLNELY